MAGQDAELDLFRKGVNCAALLERLPPAWRLDRKESTRRALKYRRGEGEVVIVNHDGRGWWDPRSAAKGDVFDLVQFLDPGLNFGQVRQVLRPFVGLSPTYPEALREARRDGPERPLPERWRAKRRLRPGSPAWRYLAEERCLPASVLKAADAADVVREGPYGNAWFAHRDDAGQLSHIEIRGPDFKGSIRGGSKTLFRLPGGEQPRRLAVTEAPIDALSLAALEGVRSSTLYVATGGGLGPGTVAALERLLRDLAGRDRPLASVAPDCDAAGEHHAAKLHQLAGEAGVASERLHPPPGHKDWNAFLQARTKGDAR